jgi:hypothetical protein
MRVDWLIMLSFYLEYVFSLLLSHYSIKITRVIQGSETVMPGVGLEIGALRKYERLR